MNIMKAIKNILTAAALIVMATGLSSCYFRLNERAKAQFKNNLNYKLSGSTKIDTVTFNVGEFQSISQEKSLDDLIFIQTDGEYKVKIVAYPETVDSVFVKNDDGMLKIGVNYSKTTTGPVQAWVYAPSVKTIARAGSGNITISKYSGDTLMLVGAGSGNIKAYDLDLSGLLMVSGAGSGDHDFRRVKAEELMILKAGSSDSEFKDINVNKVSVASIGSGDTMLSGKAESVSISKKGSGEIDTKWLKAKEIETEE